MTVFNFQNMMDMDKGYAYQISHSYCLQRKHTIKTKMLAELHSHVPQGFPQCAKTQETWIHQKTSKTLKKWLIIFITFIHIFMCKRRISTSKRSKIWSPLKSYSSATSMSMIDYIIVDFEAFDNNQWSLDWFITQVNTIGFKVNVITLVIVQTWALSIVCCKVINFYLP